MKYKNRGRTNRRKKLFTKRFKQVKQLISTLYALKIRFLQARQTAYGMAEIHETYPSGGVMPNEENVKL